MTVTTLADTIDFNDGKTSLREAIFATNTVPGADEIRFDPALFAAGPATILLKQGELVISDSLTLTGPGANLLAIDASGNDPTPGLNIGDGSRILNIDDGSPARQNVIIAAVTLTGGDLNRSSLTGGAIRSLENLTIQESAITGNAAYTGGGIYQTSGALTVADTLIGANQAGNGGGVWTRSSASFIGVTFSDNTAIRSGGGVFSEAKGGAVSITASTLSGNTALQQGGAIFTSFGALILQNVDITNNSASSGGGVYAGYGPVSVTGGLIAHNTAGGLETSPNEPRGGGLFIQLLSRFPGDGVTISGVEIRDNTAGRLGVFGGSGGGIYIRAIQSRTSPPINIVASTISGNEAGRQGGGIFVSNGAPTIAGSIISGNFAGSGGGGAYFNGLSAVVDRSTISNNSSGQGGGLFSKNSLSLSESVISGNFALGQGGGVYSGTIALVRSVFLENSVGRLDSANALGAGLFIGNRGIASTIVASTFANNTANGAGGGLFASQSIVVENSTFSGNVALQGGGLQGNKVMLRHSTVAGNFATSGAQLAGAGVLSTMLTLDHSIVAVNKDASAMPADFAGSTIVASRFSMIGHAGGSNLSEMPLGAPDANGNLIGGSINGAIDPRLASLADNGGAVLTRAPLPGSPAIDAGDPALLSGVDGVPEFDGRGSLSRRAGERIDIGAFEVQPAGGALTADFDFNGLADGGDFLAWQRNLGKPSAATYRQGDATADGDVDAYDLAVWQARFGAEPGAAPALAANASSPAPLPAPEWGREQPSTGDLKSPEPRAVARADSSAEMTEPPIIAALTTLEADSVPIVIVTTLADTIDLGDGKTSLREAIFATNTVPGADEIRFDPALFAAGPATILLTQGELKITDSLTLAGPGANLLTLDASGSDPTPDQNNGDGSRTFQFTTIGPSEFTVSALRIVGGDTAGDGGVLTAQTKVKLRLTDVRLEDNIARGRGGAIFMQGGSFEMQGGALTGNQAENDGGGAYIQPIFDAENSQRASFVDVTISNNSAGALRGSFGRGGGIYYAGSSSDGIQPVGLEIRKSDISSNAASGDGGGVYLRNSPLVMTESSIIGNVAGIAPNGIANGGGIMGRQVNASISFCRFADNHAVNSGGGIYVDFPTAHVSTVLDGCTIDGNSADRRGGGLFLSVGSLLISNCAISDNVAGRGFGTFGDGGGAYITAPVRSTSWSLIVDRSIFSNNYAGQRGGGIASRMGLSVRESAVTGNHAGASGGGIDAEGLLLLRSLVNDNFAGENSSVQGTGGGIWFGSSNPSLVDSSTITGNFAGSGGGGVAGNTDVTFINSTISGNTARYNGGGLQGRIFVLQYSTVAQNRTMVTGGVGGGVQIFAIGRFVLDHSIVANNDNPQGTSPDISGPVSNESRFSMIGNLQGSNLSNEAPLGAPDANGNLIGGPIYGVIDPFLGPLADNGGPTLTHALRPGSPAIDAGDPAFAPGVSGAPEFDGRGPPFMRVSGARIDIGAFEVQPSGGALNADFDFNGLADGGDFLAWQRNLGKPSAATYRQGDATADGDVDASDLAVWKVRFRRRSAVQTSSLVDAVAAPSLAPPSLLSLPPETRTAAAHCTQWRRDQEHAVDLRRHG